MTVTDLIRKLPLLGEPFPHEIVQDWSLEEWDKSMKAQRERTLAGLDEWIKKNERNNH